METFSQEKMNTLLPPEIKRKHFEKWLAAQPDDRKFNYTNCTGCLVSSFFEEFHGIEVSVGADRYRLKSNLDATEEKYVNFPSWLKITNVFYYCDDITKAKQDLLT